MVSRVWRQVDLAVTLDLFQVVKSVLPLRHILIFLCVLNLNDRAPYLAQGSLQPFDIFLFFLQISLFLVLVIRLIIVIVKR